jgi:hypothetical protein
MDDEDEVDLIPMGLLDGTIAFEIPFRDKLRIIGLSEPEANFIVQNALQVLLYLQGFSLSLC